MKLHFLPFLFLLPACVMAKPVEPESVKLINACKELVAMYDREGEENQLVSWFGSVSEGMQAGYCRGVIVEYRRHDELQAEEQRSSHKRCNQPDWFTQAQQIANFAPEPYAGHSIGHILESACGFHAIRTLSPR